VDYFSARQDRLTRVMVAEGLDALLITNPVNITYLTGFSGDSSYLILTRRRAILVSDGRFTEQLAQECPGLETHIRPPARTVVQATAEMLEKTGAHRVGFESGHLTVAGYETLREELPSLDWKPGADRVEKLRAVKDDKEVDQIRSAIVIAEQAFVAFRALLQNDNTEKELADAMESHIRRFGGWTTSFHSIIAVGPRSALPHASPTSKRVSESPLLLVDWGANGRFYKSDLTRVLLTRRNSAFFKPEAREKTDTDPRLEVVYRTVLKAQTQAIGKIRPGVKGGEVDAEARSVIAEAGFGEYFSHGLGHGLGLEVHEAPALRPKSESVLEPGMVVTVEPGIYIPNWGGVRIEDDVLVTPDGCEVLTSLPRDWDWAWCDLCS
jgi:Xaa-Pro aminopeptidase